MVSSTLPLTSRMVMVSSMTMPTPIMRDNTVSFWARNTSSTFASIAAR